MTDKIKILFIIGGIALFAYIVCMCFGSKESFAVDGAINGSVPLGGVYNTTPNYDVVEPTMDTFADIVAPSQPAAQSCDKLPVAMKAGEHQDYRELLPDVNTHATAYDIDVTDPETFMWRPSIRTSIHNRQHETADPLRGDLPITKGACGYSNNGWFSSRYNEGDAKLDGYFSDFTKYKFRSLTGQKSYPQYIANEGTIMDASPDEMVLDWY